MTQKPKADHRRPKTDDLALEHELHLLEHEAETLRSFYSLTGSPRKEYTEQVAEADAARIRMIGDARAEAHLAWLRAHAEGLRLVGEALGSLKNPELAIAMARLDSLERIAAAIADGQATKLFLPREFGQLLSFLSERLTAPDGSGPEDTTEGHGR